MSHAEADPATYRPEGYHHVTPFLVVQDAAGLMAFALETFAATEVSRTLAPDGSIMHAQLRIGDSLVMVADAHEGMAAMPTHLYVYVPDTDGAFQRALAAGAVAISEPENTFYGARIAGVRDPHGNVWWIATHLEDVSPEEAQRRLDAMANG